MVAEIGIARGKSSVTPKEEADWLHANPPPIHRFISIDKLAEYGFTLPPLVTIKGKAETLDPESIRAELAAIDASGLDCEAKCRARARLRYRALSPEAKATWCARANGKRKKS